MASYNPPNDDNPIFNTFNFMSDSIYQTIAGMTIYLTKTVAASTYQTIAGMANYLTTSVASTTYQTIANMTNYVSRTGSITEDITGTKTFTGTIKSNNYDTQTATTALTIGSSVTSGDINIGRNKTSGYIGIGSSFGQLSVYCSTALKATSIETGSDFNVRNIVSTDPSSTNHALFTNMTTNGVLTIGNALSSNIINGASTFNQAITASGTLKTTSIVPITPNAQHELFYNTLGATGTLFIGTAGRTLNLYGNANFSTNCQVSGDFKTDDITAISNTSTQNIYTTLTTSGGIINLGASTVNTVTNIRGGAISIGGSVNNLTIESPTKFNTKINFYSGTTNYTEFLQTGVQLTIKPVHDNGTIALFSTNTTGTQTQQLLINNSGVSASSISSTNIFSTNYNTSSQVIDFASNITTGTISLATNLTTGNLNIGNATTGSFKINIRGSLFSTGQATFQNFCPKSETDPAVANDLVKLSYLQNNFCDRSTTQIIGGEKTFTGNTIIGSALYFTDLDNTSSLNKPVIYQYGGVLFFTTNNNYSNGYEFMCNHNTTIIINQTDTEINNTVNIKGSLKYRYDKLVDEIQTLTTTNEVLHFPLQQTTIFTNTNNISVTLPQINSDTQIGLRFTFLNLGSVSTITTFNAHSPNQIIIIGQVTQVSSTTSLINNTNNSCSLVIVKLSGVYIWAEF